MCGIVGYIGNKKIENQLIEMLKKVEYRGYDSAGISFIENDKLKVVKKQGCVQNLENSFINSNSSFPSSKDKSFSQP